jgi:hypothetical protein
MPWLVVGMLSLLLSRLAGAQDYQWTEIVIPGATVFRAAGLNDKCQTAVTTTDGRTGIYRDGTFTPLPPPPQGLQVAAWGINNDGVIIGSAFTIPGTSPQGFILCGSTYRFFSRPGWENISARAIADSGLITGQSFNADGTNAGFIYDPDSDSFTDATPPGSTNTITMGMNRFGRITGSGEEPGIGRYGFVWQRRTITKGKRELRPFLARLKIDVDNTNPPTNIRGINDSGVVVGFTTNPAGGFVGNEARGYQRLVPPGGEVPGNVTFCQGINNFDQVVCDVTDSDINPLSAFIGSPVKGEGCSRQ